MKDKFKWKEYLDDEFLPSCFIASLGLGFDLYDAPDKLTVLLSLASLSMVHDVVQAA